MTTGGREVDAELAVAVSARDWADVLHRFLADHGGARVRLTAMGPEDVSGEAFDVLLIDDACSFLTPRLVHEVRRSGRAVVGVYDPDVFADGKARLVECGVTDVVESNAPPEEFLRVVTRVARSVERVDAREVAPPPGPAPKPAPGGLLIAVGGASGGVGCTEVALTVAACLSAATRPVVLVDADLAAPSIAPRLGLPLHPNVRTAVDVVAHRTGPLDRTLHPVGAMRVLPGLPHPTDEVRPRDVLDVLGEVRAGTAHVVVDMGSPVGRGVGRLLLEEADRVVVVAAPSPVGVIRLLDWVGAAVPVRPGGDLDILVNRAPRGRFRRGEIVEEITRSYLPASLAFLSDDPLVARASWDAVPSPRGPFRTSIERWLARFVVAS